MSCLCEQCLFWGGVPFGFSVASIKGALVVGPVALANLLVGVWIAVQYGPLVAFHAQAALWRSPRLACSAKLIGSAFLVPPLLVWPVFAVIANVLSGVIIGFGAPFSMTFSHIWSLKSTGRCSCEIVCDVGPKTFTSGVQEACDSVVAAHKEVSRAYKDEFKQFIEQLALPLQPGETKWNLSPADLLLSVTIGLGSMALAAPALVVIGAFRLPPLLLRAELDIIGRGLWKIVSPVFESSQALCSEGCPPSKLCVQLFWFVVFWLPVMLAALACIAAAAALVPATILLMFAVEVLYAATVLPARAMVDIYHARSWEAGLLTVVGTLVAFDQEAYASIWSQHFDVVDTAARQMEAGKAAVTSAAGGAHVPSAASRQTESCVSACAGPCVRYLKARVQKKAPAATSSAAAAAAAAAAPAAAASAADLDYRSRSIDYRKVRVRVPGAGAGAGAGAGKATTGAFRQPYSGPPAFHRNLSGRLAAAVSSGANAASRSTRSPRSSHGAGASRTTPAAGSAGQAADSNLGQDQEGPEDRPMQRRVDSLLGALSGVMADNVQVTQATTTPHHTPPGSTDTTSCILAHCCSFIEMVVAFAALAEAKCQMSTST